MKFVVRPVEILTLPISENTTLSRPERAVLRFTSNVSCDVGSICYVRRITNSKQPKDIGSKAVRLVDLGSLDIRRRNSVKKIIKFCSDDISLGAKRPTTTGSDVAQLLTFLARADENNYDFALQDINIARNVFSVYIEYLRERVRLGQITNNTAATSQLRVLRVISEILQTDSLSHGLHLLRLQKYARQTTLPPGENEQARMLALCQSLFDGLCDLVLNNKPYPYALKVPKYLGTTKNILWVFPSKKWCMPPHELNDRESLTQGFWAFDYLNGNIATVKEIWHRYGYDPKKNTKTSSAEHAIKSATKALTAANINSQDRYRRNAALMAHNAFIVLFLANTGMNWAPVQQLPWGIDYEVGIERQGFRTIKYRAAGRLVSFEIQSVFLPLFKQFLVLRSFLLDGRDFSFLFLASGNFVINVTPLYAKTLKSIVDSLKRIDPNLSSILSRQWRAGKSDWLLRNVDPSTAAIILQNSESTVLRSYAEGSPITHLEEMGWFLEQLQNSVLAKDEPVIDGVESALGVCSSYEHPHQVTESLIIPNCHEPEGCLFCDKYRVHADAKDTRKLISCRYCILQTEHMTANDEQFQRLFGPVLSRIEMLLKEIDHRESGLVQRITNEIEEGELDPYWGSKLEMLADLGLVA